MSAGGLGLAIIHLCKAPVLTYIFVIICHYCYAFCQSIISAWTDHQSASHVQSDVLYCALAVAMLLAYFVACVINILVMLDNHVMLQTCCFIFMSIRAGPRCIDCAYDISFYHIYIRRVALRGNLRRYTTARTMWYFVYNKYTCMMTNNVFRVVEHKTYSALLRLAQLRVLILVDLQHPFQPSHIVQGLPQLPSHADIGGMLTVLPT